MSKDKIILFDDKKNCCACGACMNVCPKDAIRMEEDEYGFLYPQIDETKCVQCGACKKVCAYQNEQVKNAPIKCYAAVNKIDEVCIWRNLCSYGNFCIERRGSCVWSSVRF